MGGEIRGRQLSTRRPMPRARRSLAPSRSARHSGSWANLIQIFDYHGRMIRGAVVVWLAMAASLSPAFADTGKPPVLHGTVGFDWHKPKATCQVVAGARLTK